MSRHHRKLTDAQVRWARICHHRRAQVRGARAIARQVGVSKQVFLKAVSRPLRLIRNTGERVPLWAIIEYRRTRRVRRWFKSIEQLSWMWEVDKKVVRQAVLGITYKHVEYWPESIPVRLAA